MEYSTYLETILRLRNQGLAGWVLPSVWFLDEHGSNVAEIDVVAIYAPKPHKRPVTLELREVSRDDSQTNQEDNRRKLENTILYRVKSRFNKKICVLGYFNERELFRWGAVSQP